MEEKLEVFDSQNRLDESQDPIGEQATGGGAFYVCGVKDCTKQFAGKKKEETVKRELLPHIQEVHQDVYSIVSQSGNQAEIQRLLTKSYLKKSRREQKKNYYCKICPEKEDGPPRFSQVENVHQRSGLEAHVKRQHPEFWDSAEQQQLMKENQIKWMNQWCGYLGPAKTKGGRPNKKFIIEKYNTEKDEQKIDNQLDEEDEQFFLSLGIDVRRNKQIGTEEYQKHLEISHELFNNKDKIQQMQSPMDQYNEDFILSWFNGIIDPSKQQKISNLLHLIKNQKGDDEHQYPENSKDKIQEIIRVCLYEISKMINPNMASIIQSQGKDYQFIMNDLKNVHASFLDFIESLQKNE